MLANIGLKKEIPASISTQLCSCCCYHNTGTEDLALQEWTCHKCGGRQDRDINTAKNILQKGLRLLASA